MQSHFIVGILGADEAILWQPLVLRILIWGLALKKNNLFQANDDKSPFKSSFYIVCRLIASDKRTRVSIIFWLIVSIFMTM